MDSQSNPVFFNTFDPFDNPAPPKPQSTPIPSNNINANANANDNVNTNILMPAASPGSNNPHFFPSPLDSPSINPYPLLRSSVTSSWSSPAYNQSSAAGSQAPPSYPSSSSSYSSAPTPNTTPSSSVSNTSPVHSPSLSSVHSYSSQAYQQPSQQQQQQQQPQAQSPIPPQSSPAPSPSPSPSPYSQAPSTSNASFQPQPYTPPPYPQSYKPYQPPQPTSPTPQHQPQQQQQQQSQSSSLSQSQLQQLTAPATPQFTPPSQHTPTPSSSSSSSSQMPEQTQKLLDQIVGSISAVMTRLDGIDNRISALEIATKEVLNNQRTISTQQRKLQDAVDTPKVVAAPAPAPVPVSYGQPMHYEEPRKAAPVYHPPTMPSNVGPIMPPPPSHHMPSLVPVTHISNRGERIGSASGSGSSSYDADLELAKKLQAEFDSQPSTSSSNANSNSSHASSYTPKPTPSSTPSAAKSGQQECPICSSRVAIADLEAHVEQHFEDEEAKRASLKPGEKPRDSKTEAKGFLAKLFAPKDAAEEKKPGNTEPAASTPAATSNTPQSVPYTHTQAQQAQQAQGYAQRPMPGYYPTMAPTPGQAAAMYRPAYYPYPVQGVPMQQGRTPAPAPAQSQQYLYYPNLDQAPQ